MAILQNTSFASPIPSGSNNATKKSRRGLPPLRSPGIASPVPAKNNEKGTWGGKRICDNSATLPISSPLVRDNGHHAHEPDNNEMVMVASARTESSSFSSLSSDGVTKLETKHRNSNDFSNKKKVTFSSSVRMRQVSKRDTFFYASAAANKLRGVNPIWYTREEIDDLKEEDSKLIRLMNQKLDAQSTKFQDAKDEEHLQEICRGLERRTKKGIQRSKRTRLVAMNAVLREQERQKRMNEEQQSGGSADCNDSSSSRSIEYDTNAIARAYSLFTGPTKQVAYQIALDDADYVIAQT